MKRAFFVSILVILASFFGIIAQVGAYHEEECSYEGNYHSDRDHMGTVYGPPSDHDDHHDYDYHDDYDDYNDYDDCDDCSKNYHDESSYRYSEGSCWSTKENDCYHGYSDRRDLGYAY